MSGTAHAAEKYTEQFVHAILKGLRAHLKRKGLLHGGPVVTQRHFPLYSPSIETSGQNLGEKCAQIISNYPIACGITATGPGSVEGEFGRLGTILQNIIAKIQLNLFKNPRNLDAKTQK